MGQFLKNSIFILFLSTLVCSCHEENKFKWERSNTEKKNKVLFRRSLRYKRDLSKGSVLSENDLIFVRPGDGIGLEEKSLVLGKKILHDVKKNEPCIKKNLI